MNFTEIIRKKRDGLALNSAEINFAINNYSSGKIPDYQFSSFLMAGFINGLNEHETSSLTRSMLNSGKTVEFSLIRGKKIDKHSTGGVGDKTSLIIAPIVAAAGVYVPMISGRGLGHTGGTLDKLESIPGFRTDLTLSEYKKVLKKCGAVLIGQTKEIAPADKLIYALRDVTATVESIPFITASIMSKKLAEGIDGLVLDVKTGNGAFMKSTKEAITLTRSLVKTAKQFNKKVIAFITDMNQPLGRNIGNWLEVKESIDVLRGKQNDDLFTLSIKLAGAMIYLGKKSGSIAGGIRLAEDIIRSGKAFYKFIEIIKLQSGKVRYILQPEFYPASKYSRIILSPSGGYIKSINCFQLGLASVELGAGRKMKEDVIDPKAGIIMNVKLGTKVNKGDLLATIFSDKHSKIKIAEQIILDSIEISKQTPKKIKLIKKIIK
jgi:pyrimidine-nucleoside phosphorylase